MKRARSGKPAGLSGRQNGGSPVRWHPAIRWRAATFGVLAVVSLLLTVGCSADAGAGDSLIRSAPPAVGPVPAAPGAATPEAPTSSTGTGGTAAGEGSHGQAPAAARATLEEALRRASDGGKPSTEQLRGALAAAGFAAADVEVTAGRTPTGLDADAVEVGVKQGGECLVAQVRGGAASVTVLPVLADGRCLVGAARP